MDAYNARFSRVSLRWRVELERQWLAWMTKFEMWMPRYTTQINELPVAHA